MEAKINQRVLFKTIQAIERAKLATPAYDIAGYVRIDSRNHEEKNFLTKMNFLQALKELHKLEAIKLEDYPNQQNKNTQFHYQIRPGRKYKSIFKKLEKEFPDLKDLQFKSKKFQCSELTFYSETGKCIYGKVKTQFRPYSQAWAILYLLMDERNNSISIERLRNAIITAAREKGGKKTYPKEDSINVKTIIRYIRRKLKMGATKNSINKNLIESIPGKNAYRIKDQ